jgi:hypothetical protein
MARPRSVLSFDGEPHGLILVQTVVIPESLEEIEAEIATKRLLDDLAVPLSLTGGPHSDPAEYVFIESYCGTHPSHLCIIAYRCLRALVLRTLGRDSGEQTDQKRAEPVTQACARVANSERAQ